MGFGVLMVLSAASLWLLPKEWSDALKHLGQPMVWLEDWLYRAAHSSGRSLNQLGKGDSDESAQSPALIHMLASQIAVADELRQENARIRALRDTFVPPGVPLLPAKIVARDIVEWRDSVLVERGSSRNVRRKDWVASRFFVNQGRVQEVAEGQAVLAGECLLGRIEQVSPYMSSVQLLTDIDSPRIEVRIGSLRDTVFEFIDFPCSLRGIGRGQMAIEDVDYRRVREVDPEQGDIRRRIKLGDLVFSAPGQLGLPMPLVIGKIVEFKEDPKKRLVVSLVVEPSVTIEQLREVLIIPLVPPERVPIRE